MSASLPQEMQSHTYSIMYEIEETHWWYAGRRLILKSFIEKAVRHLNTKESLQILDVGCGTGANLEMLDQFGETRGVDVSDEALAFCRKRGLTNVEKGLAEDLPFEDESFDLVTAFDVVEHLDNDLAGLKEMQRVLRGTGKALLFVPAFMFLWGVQDDVSNHRRRYTKNELCARLVQAGFEIERITYANLTFFFPILTGRLLMKLTGFRPASENNLTVGALNDPLGKLFGLERLFLHYMNFPFGVSLICVAKKSVPPAG